MLNDATFLNPSYISFLPTYSLAINYGWYKNAEPPSVSSHGRNYSVGIQDGRSELFQGGASYTQREDGTFVHLAASKALDKQFSVGIGGKFFFNDDIRPSGKDLSAAATWIVSHALQLAVTADNVLQADASKARGMFREYALGTKVNLNSMVLLYADPHYAPDRPNTKYGWQAGAELVATSDFLIRGGVFRNSSVPFAGQRGRGFGLGIGWIGPRISFDYGLERLQKPFTATTHQIGATMYF